MKLHLPLSLLSAVLGVAMAAGESAADLGNVMYVGDSITHGVNSASYRWAMHKILVDNGIAYEEVGVMQGNNGTNIVAPGTLYGGRAFYNIHSSQASARAWEISGRKDAGSKARFEHSNIANWLGQSETMKNGQTYTGTTYTRSTGKNTFTEANGNLPSTFFLLIGTNDLLSDIPNNTISTQLPAIQQNLLGTQTDGTWSGTGDMDAIVNSMRTANSESEVIVLSIPCWTQHANNNTAESHQAVADYNTALKSWAEAKGVTYVDINEGILDVSSSTPFYGPSSMFNKHGSDGLHPSAQGDLLMAGNIAKALGYAGRSAGQQRKGTAEMAVNFHDAGNPTAAPVWESTDQLAASGFSVENVTVAADGINMGAAGNSAISCAWSEGANLNAGFTLDLNLALGNGGTDGVWNTADNLSVTLGSDTFFGTLNVNEAYITWGDTVLYSADMSQNTETLRLSWLPGYSQDNLKSGYYVWLGDMLIGEALDVTYATGKSGLTIQYGGSGTALIRDLALDGTGAFAPTTTGFTTSSAYTAAGYDLPLAVSEAQGNVAWVENGLTHTATNLTAGAGSTYNARAQADGTGGAAGNVVSTEVTGGAAFYIYANQNNYQGDVWATVSGGSASKWSAAHGGGTLTGSAYMKFTEDFTGGSTVFGAVNATKVTGNVYVELSATGATYASFTSTSAASLVGSYATNIDGNVDLVVNAGTLNYQVMGGIFSGDMTIGGKASVYINGGTVKGNVMGGGLTGTINGGSSVTVAHYAVVEGNVYGGGQGGTINAPAVRSRASLVPATVAYASFVELTGGTVKGDVYGGGKDSTISGNTGCTINGNTGVLVNGCAVTLHDGSAWGNINGGSESGTVNGESVITLQNIEATTSAYAFDKYAGTINGGTNVAGDRTLVLDNVQLTMLKAELINFTTVVAANGTRTTLTSFGGASTVSVGDNCSLVVETEDVSTLTQLLLGENASLSIRAALGENVLVDISGSGSYSLTLTGLSDGWETDVSNIHFLRDGVTYEALLTAVDTQAGSGMLVAGNRLHAIPEPTTATLSLLALAGLAARRRRRA